MSDWVAFEETAHGTIAQIAETLFFRFLDDQGWGRLKPECEALEYEPDPARTDEFLDAVRIKTFQNTYQWELHWAKTYGWYFHASHWWSVAHPESLETLHAWTQRPNAAQLLYNFGLVHPTLEPPVTLKPSLEALFQRLGPADRLFFRCRWPHPEALLAFKALCPDLVVVNLRDLGLFEAKYEQKVTQWQARRRRAATEHNPEPDIFSLEPDGTFRPDLFDWEESPEAPFWVHRDHLQEYQELYQPGMRFLEGQEQATHPFYVNKPISNGGKLKYRPQELVMDWPDIDQLFEATQFILAQSAEGRRVLFHCRGGRHRTGMVALLLEKLELMATGRDTPHATHQLKQKYARHVTGLDGHVSGFRPANLSAVNQLLSDRDRREALLAAWHRAHVTPERSASSA